MIGLLLKDFTVIKKQLKLMILVLFFYAIWAFYEKNTTMFAYMAVMFGFFIPLTAIGFDERAEWNKYALCMPIKKSYVATSKYLLGFLSITVATIGYYLLTILLNSGLTLENMKIGLALLSAGMILLSFYLPVCFRFGAERARYVIIAMGIIPCLLIIIANKAGKSVKPSQELLDFLLNMAPVIAFAIVVISCMLSIKIVENKEY